MELRFIAEIMPCLRVQLFLKQYEEGKMEICIANLSAEVTRQDVKEIFEEYGKVAGVSLANDGARLIGFVLMPLRDEGLAAIKALNGTEFKGLPVSVRETTEREAAEMK
jgi:RNA recognition motif-containing protein